MKGYHQVGHTKLRGTRTPSKTNNTLLDCVFVKPQFLTLILDP